MKAVVASVIAFFACARASKINSFCENAPQTGLTNFICSDAHDQGVSTFFELLLENDLERYITDASPEHPILFIAPSEQAISELSSDLAAKMEEQYDNAMQLLLAHIVVDQKVNVDWISRKRRTVASELEGVKYRLVQSGNNRILRPRRGFKRRSGVIQLAAKEAYLGDDAVVVVADAVLPVASGILDTRSFITTEEVEAAQIAWGNGIVHIGEVFTADGDFVQAARDHINSFYGYENFEVLFKPTLASEDQFRGTFDEALSYFVGNGTVAEDNGFAIAPYVNVTWENEGIQIETDSATAMGNYYFTRTNGDIVKVEYTFGYVRGPDGNLDIVLHHSSLPYTPAN
eukprot:TRINITY_DN9925_c0_g1_i2.p1 TRINITY_DN9925_c0_g1~~TRINITY_DN9925_c0_g1_i2.p1  ORF type:complete len:345 (+),score=87.49 TRINITY_DN9925_c0_g1_i2:73-1107(+)